MYNMLDIDPFFVISLVLMQVGARHLDFGLTDFQQKLIKNDLAQAIILFAIIYIAVRDILKTALIVTLIYITIYVLFNEKHKLNIFSKKWLFNEGIINEYEDIKNKYYNKIAKIKNDYYI